MKQLYSIFLLLVLGPPLWAQNDALLKKIKAENQHANSIMYNYKIVLRNLRARKDIDSIQGALYTSSGQYLDSNKLSITARMDRYLCVVNQQAKTISVNDMSRLNKKSFNQPFDNSQNPLSITDSLLAQKGTYDIDSSNPLFYRLTMRLKKHQIRYAQLDFSKANYKMVAVYFEMLQPDPADKHNFYVQTFRFSNVRPILDMKVFDLNRFFSIKNQQIIPSRKYAAYTISKSIK